MKGDIRPFLTSPDISIVEAMRLLEETAEKVLFVVDAENRLAGSLTDGDIRRWILAGGGLDASVSKVCNRSPHTVAKSYRLSAVKTLMLEKKLECIPVVNRAKQVMDLIFWKDVFQDDACRPLKRIDIPVVIMAGGKGTRLDPFTRILPKPLIPIGDKPVIEIIIDRFKEYGIREYYISVNHKARIIKSYFEERAPDYFIEYIEEDIPLGTAGSLCALSGKLRSSLIVTNCDIIINSDYGEIVDHHYESGNDITLVVSLKRYRIPYGICNVENGGCLVGIDEKPEYNFLVNTGLYILKSEALELIPQNQFFHMTDLIARAKLEGKRVGVFPISENSWIDTGEWEEYRKAVDKIRI